MSNPCLLKGWKVTVNASEIFEEQCVSSKYATDLVGSTIDPPSVSVRFFPRIEDAYLHLLKMNFDLEANKNLYSFIPRQNV